MYAQLFNWHVCFRTLWKHKNIQIIILLPALSGCKLANQQQISEYLWILNSVNKTIKQQKVVLRIFRLFPDFFITVGFLCSSAYLRVKVNHDFMCQSLLCALFLWLLLRSFSSWPAGSPAGAGIAPATGSCRTGHSWNPWVGCRLCYWTNLAEAARLPATERSGTSRSPVS